MKKTLFALLACATLAAPAMAKDWSVLGGWFLPYGDQTNKDDYTFYLYHDTAADITSVSANIANMTLSEFTTTAGTGYAFTQDGADGTMATAGTPMEPLITGLSADPATYWGVCVYNGADAGFMVAESGTAMYSAMGLVTYSVYDFDTEHNYTSFKSGSPATPEPATATLSLMALAGLCARRRRH